MSVGEISGAASAAVHSSGAVESSLSATEGPLSGEAGSKQKGRSESRVHLSWIVDARTDLPWFIGGALAGYALFAMHAFLGWNMLLVWMVWYVLLDIPHFFGTYVRTYLDREEFRRRRMLLCGSLGLLLAGPLVLLISFAMLRSGQPLLARHYALPYQLLFVFVSLWAYWHVVRQHYGFLALYKRKNHDHARMDGRIDRTLLYVGLWAPLVALVLYHPDARVDLGLGEAPMTGWRWERVILVLSIVLVATAIVVFIGRQAQLWRNGQPLNMPKILFLSAVVPLHMFVCYHPAVLTASLLAFSAFVTIFHDLQYHAIVWHTQKNRLRQAGGDGRRLGLAGWISRHFLIYMSCALALGIGSYLLGCALDIEFYCGPLFHSSKVALFGAFTLSDLFLSVALGLIMHHYFVDQFIWRPSKDTRLRQELQVSQG